jgi:hypothetical protein
LNSSAVIQRRCSTIMRRAQGSAPPKPDTETITKALNNSPSDGRTDEADNGGSR